MEKQIVQASCAKERNFTFNTSMKKIALWLLLLSSLGSFGQNSNVDGQFVYGFSVGAEFQTLNIGIQPQRPNAPIVLTERLTGIGAGLGLWGQWPVLPVLFVRPGVQFSQMYNTIQFEHPDGQITRDRYTFSDLELPLHFILTDYLQRLPVKALILFGGRVSWNLAAFDLAHPLKLLPERAGLDIGVGAGFSWGRWMIQPEIIYSYGLNNVHDFQNTNYDWAVGRVLRDRLSVRVVFGY